VAGRITFHEKIGSHDVAVVQALSTDRFVQWVQQALSKAGVKNPKVPDWMKQNIQRYLNEGYTWFVFDTIDIGTELQTVEPLRYRFKTDKLFYPLRITKVKGISTVDLIILSPRLLSKFPALPNKRVSLAHPPATLTPRDLRFIDKEMAEMLDSKSDTKLRIWKIRDYGQGFSADLIAH
jgi:hypothetical protein